MKWHLLDVLGWQIADAIVCQWCQTTMTTMTTVMEDLLSSLNIYICKWTVLLWSSTHFWVVVFNLFALQLIWVLLCTSITFFSWRFACGCSFSSLNAYLELHKLFATRWSVMCFFLLVCLLSMLYSRSCCCVSVNRIVTRCIGDLNLVLLIHFRFISLSGHSPNAMSTVDLDSP